MHRSIPLSLCLAALLSVAVAPAAAAQEADLILTNARVWTGEPARPWAEAVAVRSERILAVGAAAEVERHRTARTRVIDAGGRLVTPGFIDNHTHFDQAGALLLGANLLDVAEPRAFARRVREARERLPEGAWILGGEWGAYEDWAAGDTGAQARRGARRAQRFRPTRALIDSITPGTPALLSRWDRSEHLANAVALERAGLSCAGPVEGLACERGRATGIVTGEALRRIRESIPPKSFEQRLMEARPALRQLAEYGVTGIHDITPPAQFAVYRELQRRGELSTRVYGRPTLDKWEPLAAAGITHGFGDEWVRVGGLKGFVDGIMGASTAMFYEPFAHTGGFGVWREMMQHPSGMQGLIEGALHAGHWPQIHAIGDRAIDTLLVMYERAYLREGGARHGARLRVIHAQHLRGPEAAERMALLGVIAEVQPYHAIDDMRWMEERIGPERLRWTYAFRTLRDAGVRLSFGSDWPGTHASFYPANPLLGIYAAVTRQTLEGEPIGGWIPEERIDVETALRAYTVNNAYAAGEEDEKGSLAPGKLADLVVLDRDILAVPPSELRDARVLLTMVGGWVVHDAEGMAAASGGTRQR